MATLIHRPIASAWSDRPGMDVVAFRMYPDSAAILRVHAPGQERSVLNIHLTPAEADRLAEALTRTRS